MATVSAVATTSNPVSFVTVTVGPGSLPPLTAFTPPSSCGQTLGNPELSLDPGLSSGGNTVYNYDAFASGEGVIYISECWPPSYSDIWLTPLVDTITIAYLGGVCPGGFTSACSLTYGSKKQDWCCPLQYSCFTSTTSWRWCQSTFTSPKTIWATTSGSGYAQIVLPSVASGRLAFPNIARAKPVPIERVATPLTSSTTAIPSNTSSTVPNASTAASSTSSPTTIPSNVSSTPLPTGELSTAAKAGIGVGAGFFTLAIIGLLCFFILRSRRRKGFAPGGHSYETRSELPGGHMMTGYAGYEPRSQLHGSIPKNLLYNLLESVNSVPVEMPSHPFNSNRVERPQDSAGVESIAINRSPDPKYNSSVPEPKSHVGLKS